MKDNIFTDYQAQIITDRIIELMEKGQIPWSRPWQSAGEQAIKWTSGTPYSFLNQLMLGEPGVYLTWNMIKTANKEAYPLKGTGRKIFSPNKKTYTSKDEDTGEEKMFSIITGFHMDTVFHIKDTVGLDEFKDKWAKPIIDYHLSVEPNAEKVVDYYLSSNPELRLIRDNKSDRAFYSPTFDSVTVPEIVQFKSTSEYYSTLFHELTHSTGHKSRLDRLKDGKESHFGGQDYSREELVAEIGAASLVNYCNLETEDSFKNSTAYIQSWASHIKNDPQMFPNAVVNADKAYKYILGYEKEE